MYRTHLDVLASVLKVSKKKLQDKGITSIWDRVTTLEREGIELTMSEAYGLLKQKFFEEFPLEEGELTDYELNLVEKLVKERYGLEEWNFLK